MLIGDFPSNNNFESIDKNLKHLICFYRKTFLISAERDTSFISHLLFLPVIAAAKFSLKINFKIKPERNHGLYFTREVQIIR